MQVTPYLNFRNQCREAFTEYAVLLGGEIDFIQTFAETPEMGDVARDRGDAVMHASLRFPGGTLLGSDAPGEMYQPAQGLWVGLQVEQPRGGRAALGRARQGRHGSHAAGPDLLGAEIRYGDRPLRHALDDQLRLTRRAGEGRFAREQHDRCLLQRLHAGPRGG